MSLSSSVYESGVVKQVQKTENGAKSKQGSGGHAPNATDGQSGTGNSSTLSPSPSLTPPPFQCLPLTKPTRAVSESQQGSCVSSECEGASSNEQNPLKLRETAKRHSPGGTKCHKICAYEHCPSPLHSKKWRMVTTGTSAGGRDWEPLVGKTLCDSCYSTYRKHGTFVRSIRTNEGWSRSGTPCAHFRRVREKARDTGRSGGAWRPRLPEIVTHTIPSPTPHPARRPPPPRALTATGAGSKAVVARNGDTRRAGAGADGARERTGNKDQSKTVSPRVPRSPKRPRAFIDDANAAPSKRPGRKAALKSRLWWRPSKPGAPAELGEHELLDAVAILTSLQNSLPCHDVGDGDDADAEAQAEATQSASIKGERLAGQGDMGEGDIAMNDVDGAPVASSAASSGQGSAREAQDAHGCTPLALAPHTRPIGQDVDMGEGPSAGYVSDHRLEPSESPACGEKASGTAARQAQGPLATTRTPRADGSLCEVKEERGSVTPITSRRGVCSSSSSPALSPSAAPLMQRVGTACQVAPV